jgi:SAM-dependent methyltransferase
MTTNGLNVMRQLTPPLVWRGMKSVLVKSGLYGRDIVGREQSSDWYDSVFSESKTYKLPYRQSPYYFLWCVVVDRIMRSGATSVLDIGCGPGQVACFLRDKGLGKYTGIDLSPVAIQMAEKQCPGFHFIATNALETNAFGTVEYDTAISFEFLEHVEDELKVLRRLAPGTRFWGTVPNFEYVSHVRHFSSSEEVIRRYSELFAPLVVDSFDAPNGTHRYYLMEGVKV